MANLLTLMLELFVQSISVAAIIKLYQVWMSLDVKLWLNLIYICFGLRMISYFFLILSGSLIMKIIMSNGLISFNPNNQSNSEAYKKFEKVMSDLVECCILALTVSVIFSNKMSYASQIGVISSIYLYHFINGFAIMGKFCIPTISIGANFLNVVICIILLTFIGKQYFVSGYGFEVISIISLCIMIFRDLFELRNSVNRLNQDQ